MQYAIGLDDHATHPHTVLRADGSVEARFDSEDAARRTADALNGASRTDSAPAQLVRRYDRHPLGKAEDTSIGGVRAPAYVTQAGVFDYRDPAGRTIREYRPLGEIASKRALDSMRDMPVTVGHPPEGVSVETFKALAVGHVSGNPSVVGGKVATHVVAQDATAARAVRAGQLVELSCGYDCALDFTPGLTGDGVPFDAIQKGHTYNHVALLQRGDARLGPEMRVHLDSHAQETVMKLTLDGHEYDLSIPAQLAAYTKRQGELDAERQSLRGENAAQAKQLKDSADAQAKREADDAAKAMAEALTAARAGASVIAPAYKPEPNATARQVQEGALKHADSTAEFNGWGDEAVSRYFEVLVKAASKGRDSKRADGISQIRQAVQDAADLPRNEHRIDGSGATAQAAYEQMHRDIFNRRRAKPAAQEG